MSTCPSSLRSPLISVPFSLLVLRPDVLREVTSSENHAKAELAARERFLETLKKVRVLQVLATCVADTRPYPAPSVRSFFFS